MPELPEVETTRRGISPHIEQQIVEKAIIRQPSLRWPVPACLRSCLVGQKIHSVQRRAKYLLLEMDTGHLIMHLGMSGKLGIFSGDNSPQKHDHFELHFDNGKQLRFNDPRRFGAVLWTECDPYEHKLLLNLGPEPLSRHFSARYLFQSASNKSCPTKSLIMNNKVVVGVGNIYATEVLFKSGIHPLRPAYQLTRKEVDVLVSEIKAILKVAIKKGGTTLRDFLNSDGKPGYFSQQLLVYGRQNHDCLSCHNPLKSITIQQRNTVFCPECQR